MNLLIFTTALAAFSISTPLTMAQGAKASEGKPKVPVEVGSVNWHRNLKEVKQLSKKSNKPILVLFQEVPG